MTGEADREAAAGEADGPSGREEISAEGRSVSSRLHVDAGGGAQGTDKAPVWPELAAPNRRRLLPSPRWRGGEGGVNFGTRGDLWLRLALRL